MSEYDPQCELPRTTFSSADNNRIFAPTCRLVEMQRTNFKTFLALSSAHTHTLDFVVPDSGLMTGSSSSSLYIHLSLSPCFCLTKADLVNGSLTRHCVCCRWSLMMGTYYGNDETITLLTTNTLRRLSSSLFGPSHTCLGL